MYSYCISVSGCIDSDIHPASNDLPNAAKPFGSHPERSLLPLAQAVAVCEMSVQHLRGTGKVCETIMQHLHTPFTVCEMSVQYLHSVVAVCEMTMQRLRGPFTVCGVIMQHLHSVVAVCETTMQHLRSPFVMCAPTRVQSFISAGCLVGRMQFAPTRVPGQTSLPPQGPPLHVSGKLRCPRRGRPYPGTIIWPRVPGKLRRRPQTPPPPSQLLGIVNA